MLKITPTLQEHIEDYIYTRHQHLELLHKLKNKIDHEIAAIQEAQPHQHEIFQHPNTTTNHEPLLGFNHTLIFKTTETKAQLQHIHHLINRQAKTLGLDNNELWKHITESF